MADALLADIKNRIKTLDGHRLGNIWMESNGKTPFSAAKVLKYTSHQWGVILLYSGLYRKGKNDESVPMFKMWPKKLGVFTLNLRSYECPKEIFAGCSK